MSWLRNIPFGPRPSRLQFVKDAPSIQVRRATPAIFDTEQLAKLADGIAAMREEVARKREACHQAGLRSACENAR
jgi:hypothetical protein